MPWLLGNGTVYGKNYRTVAPPLRNWGAMTTWCTETFGPSTGSIWGHQTPTVGERWYQNNAKFWFRDEKDLTMFILRWS